MRGSRPLSSFAGLLILLLLGVGILGGCAYFNTLSNARRYFREAENMPLDPQGKITSNARKKYDDSIQKCKKLLNLYPNSKYVDDAIFLTARAHFAKSEFGFCLRRLNELEERFPVHPWRERALFMRGICYLEDGDEARALADLQRLQDDFPESEHLAEGIYRSGEAEYRLGNWEAAIEAYRRLLASFEESDWNDEALLRIAYSQRELSADSLAVMTLADLAARGHDRRKVFEGQLFAAEILFAQRRYAESRELLDDLEPVAGNFQSRGEVLLLQARTDEVAGELEAAVTRLENVATEFPRSNHAAEAWYRIGLIRQNREGDLESALTAFDQAKKEVPRSLFADLAGNKRRAIQELLDYQSNYGEAPPDSSAAEIQFRLAENQFLLLENPEAAVLEYRKILDEHPDSPLASRAAYAIAYIQRNNLADSSAARVAAALLLERYPESEAASFVREWRIAPEPAP